MDSSAWIGFSILVAVILLLGYVRKASSAHSKKLGKLFDRICKEKKLHIAEKIHWDTGIIGIDPEKSAVAFVQEHNHILEHSIFYLTSINSCKVIHDRKPNSTKIVLAFDFGDANMQPFNLCFYDSSIDILASLPELKEKAEKVKDAVQELIQKRIK
mgnify:CR=1 FL=1